MKIPILPVVLVALISLLALQAAQGAALGHPKVNTVNTAVITKVPTVLRPVTWLPLRASRPSLGEMTHLLAVLWQLGEKLGSQGKEEGESIGDVAWCKRQGKTE